MSNINTHHYKKVHISTFKNLLWQVLCIAMLLGCQQIEKTNIGLTHTTPPTPINVKFAGLAFLGDWSQRENRYPMSASILSQMDDNGIVRIDTSLRTAIQNVNNPQVMLEFNLEEHSSKDSLALAFAISNERVSTQQYREKFLVSYEISANIITFDFMEKKVIGNYPVIVRYAELIDSMPTIQHKHNVLANMFFNPHFEINVLNTLIDAFNNISLRRSHKNYIQITKLTLDEKVIEQLVEMEFDQKAYGHTVAQYFESLLSANQSIPVVPFSRGEVIGSNMSARFSNGTVFNLQLPQPDYSIEITLMPFRKKIVPEDNYIQTVYGGNIKVLVSQPDINKVYLDGNFWKTAIQTQSVEDNVVINDRDEYDKVLIGLMDELTQQISIREKDWLNVSTRTSNVIDQLKQFEDLLSRIR